MRILTTGRSKLMYFTKSLKEILETIPLVLLPFTNHTTYLFNLLKFPLCIY